jgi:UDP-2,4-diacetamido-2,4,6-trideoxy-beta-L-altropyranose hydrolase
MENKQSLLIRADASTQIGTGHIMRCLALAQAWQAEGGEAIFSMATEASGIETRLQQGGFKVVHHYAPLGSDADAIHTISLAQQYQINRVVVDGYHFGAEFQRKLKAAGLRVLFVDDNGHAEHYYADWVLNQNIHAHDGLYAKREPYTQLLLGTRYVLLRKEFWPWRGWQRQITPVGRKVLVTLGGSDPDNITLQVIRALQKVGVGELEAVVVVGGSNPHYEVLQQAVREGTTQIELRQNVDNMPELMAWADMAITAGGSTCWELAFMGLPSLILILAENQKRVAQAMDTIGAAKNIGWHTTLNHENLTQQVEKFFNFDERQDMSSQAQVLVDGKGVSRLTKLLGSKTLTLRPVSNKDCKLLWMWVNDPDVRASSFSSKFISWEEHRKWFEAQFKNPNCFIFIAIDNNDQPVGQIRFDLQDDYQAEIDISIAKNQRGFGYGKYLLQIAIRKIFHQTNIEILHASIKAGNYSSQRIFESNHFQKSFEKNPKNNESEHYILTRINYERRK